MEYQTSRRAVLVGVLLALYGPLQSAVCLAQGVDAPAQSVHSEAITPTVGHPYSREPLAVPDVAPKVSRMRIAGWTTTAAGSLVFAGGVIAMSTSGCRSDPYCDDDDVLGRTIVSTIPLALGFVTATTVGLPLLVRARRLSKRVEPRSTLALRPTLGGAVLSGTFQ
ncbi:MAG: hypothetical protein AAF500_05340 [Myxococcota bacterium]